MESMKERDMEYCSYNLGGFIGTIPDHAARQGLSASTVYARRRRGWKLSEALGYVKRAGPDNPSILVAPRRLAIEMEYGKLFDEVLVELQGQGYSISGAAKHIKYDPRALYRYLADRPSKNPWINTMYSPVADRFKCQHGISVAEWLKVNAKKYTKSAASAYIGYAALSTFCTYLRTHNLDPVFRGQGKHYLHRGKRRNIQDHAAAAGIAAGTVSARMHRGMTLHQALTTPVAKPRRKVE